jgi:hypothetical protein
MHRREYAVSHTSCLVIVDVLDVAGVGSFGRKQTRTINRVDWGARNGTVHGRCEREAWTSITIAKSSVLFLNR